jgi:hypothetical protein
VAAELGGLLVGAQDVAIAFQRIERADAVLELGSPGTSARGRTGIVLTYGVLRSPAGVQAAPRASA